MKWLRLKLPEKLRRKLKKPLGELISGSNNHIYLKILSLIDKYKPVKLVSVGDRVSYFLFTHGIKTDVIIIDNREKRRPCTSSLGSVSKNIIRVHNQPGYIESEAWNVVSHALNKGDTTIIVDGEEDLLVLAVASLAPKKTLIFYGQPNMGVVVVMITDEFKRYIVMEIIRKMIIE